MAHDAPSLSRRSLPPIIPPALSCTNRPCPACTALKAQLFNQPNPAAARCACSCGGTPDRCTPHHWRASTGNRNVSGRGRCGRRRSPGARRRSCGGGLDSAPALATTAAAVTKSQAANRAARVGRSSRPVLWGDGGAGGAAVPGRGGGDPPHHDVDGGAGRSSRDWLGFAGRGPWGPSSGSRRAVASWSPG